MLKKTKIIVLIGTIIGVIYVGLVSELQQNNAQTETSKLTLEISTAKTDYLQIEPVSLNLNLSNRTAQQISWNGLLMIGPDINFVSRNATGDEFRFEGNKYVTGLLGSSAKSMLAGEQTSQEILLDRHLAEVLFPNAGQYTLQAEFLYRPGAESRQQIKILSNPVSVNINEPTGINRQAYEYIKGPLEEVNSKSDLRVIVQSEEEFLNRFRNSVYAKYISVSLARTYQTLGQHEKALRELCKISKENFYYSKEVQKKVFEIDSILRPVTLPPLPEDVPTPKLQNPCLLNNVTN